MISHTFNQLAPFWLHYLPQVIDNALYYRKLPNWANRIIAGLMLFSLSPILLVTMLIIRLESPGSAIFSQSRVGKNGRRFNMYKFRSMYTKQDRRYQEPSANDSDRDGICKKYVNDPRITRFGRIIRKFSIDELPQLINVLKGDMSLVGPRPALPSEVQEYTRSHYSRLDCQPGLTGLWQISGRADTTFEEQIILDKLYIKNRTIWLDLKILLMTIPTVIMAKGAY